MAIEGIFTDMSKDLIVNSKFKKDIILLCNRGCMDVSSDMDNNEFISMIESQNWSLSMLRDSR